MKIVKNIFLLIALQIFQFGFSQEGIHTKKQIEKMLLDAGDSFYKIEIDKSLNLSKLALKDAQELKDNVLMAKAYNVIGLNFEEFYDVNKSITYYDYALVHAKLTNNDTIKDWIYNNLGNVYSVQKIDVLKGINFYKKALTYSEKINDSSEINDTKLNLVGAYFSVNKYDEGLKYLNECQNFVNTKGGLEAKISLNSYYGSYYSFLNQNDKAAKFYNEAVRLAKKNTLKIVNINICELYNDIANFYKKNKNYEKAYYYLNLHNVLKEQVYKIERFKRVKAAGSEIELHEYQRQIDKIELENYQQLKNLKESRLIVLLFIVILFILLLLLYSLYKNNNLREQTNDALKEANAELTIAKEKAEEASQLKTQFVSTISHELRTPLYGVVGITNIILDEHKELAGSPHLNSLKFSSRYLLSLVNDLLQINKIEENKIILENMIFNITDELVTIVDSLEFIAVKNNNKLITEIDSNIPEFLIGDKLRLSQIFMNLISNALKFTKDGTVSVFAKLERIENFKHYIHFDVIDTGVGIAKEDQKKIFEKFVQIERKEGDYQGTGLGLSIVQKLIELFGSEIHIESEVDRGTKFSFTIGFDADESKKNEIINNIDVDLSLNQFYKILVVEDNKINQIVTKKILETNNFKSTILDDGYAAINLLENEYFDIILMDINMPIINGYETTRLIRKKGITTPIIALTAFDKEEITEQALSAGMNDIIIKPFEQAKLFQIINNLINKKETD